ncbi:MAG TPA: hypothetical protein VJH94_02790 [Candidatus Paceibacterota bacterium]
MSHGGENPENKIEPLQSEALRQLSNARTLLGHVEERLKKGDVSDEALLAEIIEVAKGASVGVAEKVYSYKKYFPGGEAGGTKS